MYSSTVHIIHIWRVFSSISFIMFYYMRENSRKSTGFANTKLLFCADHILDQDRVRHRVIDAPNRASEGLDLVIDVPNPGIDTQDRVTDNPGRATDVPDHVIGALNLATVARVREIAVHAPGVARVRDLRVLSARPETTTKVDLVPIRAISQYREIDRRPNHDPDRDHAPLPRKWCYWFGKCR